MKNLLRICVFAVFLLTPLVVMADKYTDEYGTTYIYSVKKGQASIKSMRGRTDRVRIPSFVVKNGTKIPVKSVDFYESSILYGTTFNTTVLQLEEGIERIEENCFADFHQLYEVYIPQSIQTIEKNAFKNGRNISFPILPTGVLAADLLKGNSIHPEPLIVLPTDPIQINDVTIKNRYTSVDDPVNIHENIVGIAGQSDVDVFIPSGNVQREMTFCLIIANEKYYSNDTPDVSWAETDGNTFYKYCRTTLGIPYENVRFVRNADYLKMKKQIEWLGKVSTHYGANAKFIFYYAGHGAPDDNGKCYLIPCNGSVNDITTGYSLSDVYGMLSSMTSQSSLVLVDACFSGNDRHDLAMGDGKRGIGRVQEQTLSGNVVAITAASNNETALAYDEKAHGLFTYYLLKALQEKRGEITYGELYDYVKQEVGGRSILIKDKEQTPSVSCGSKDSSWRSIKF